MADAQSASGGGRRSARNRCDRRSAVGKHSDAPVENFQLCYYNGDNSARRSTTPGSGGGGVGEALMVGGAANGSAAGGAPPPIEERARHDEDARMIFLCNYVTKSMKIKHDKWTRMLQTDEYNRSVVEFLETHQHRALFITLNFNGALVVDTALPRVLAAQAAKNCYFVKRAAGAISKCRPPGEAMIFGDLAGVLSTTLVALNEEVLFPLIKTQIEARRWPPITLESVDKQLNEFNSALYQMKGSLDGITLLPLPHEANSIRESADRLARNETRDDDVALKALIDSYIAKWCTIITNILKNSPQSLFENNQYPGPMQELNFWRRRAANLNNIYKQLKMRDARELLAYAELWHSTHMLDFHKTFEHLVGAIVEAQEIANYMSGLQEQFMKFEELNVNDLAPHIGPLVHCIGLLWRKCSCYRKNDRVACLLQAVANALIQACARTMNPYALFMGDPDETLQKISQSTDVVALFLRVYEFVKSRSAAAGEIDPWPYSATGLFRRLFQLQQRLALIDNLITTSLVFNKLEKIEIGGSKGGALSKQINQIREEFLGKYQTFQNIQYNALDLDDDRIDEDYKVFQAACGDFDNRLATIFVWAFADCKNLEACYKFVQVLGVFASRDVIQRQLQPHYAKMVRMLEAEMAAVRSLYDAVATVPGSNYNRFNYPPLYERVRWLRALRERTERHLNDFKEVRNEETGMVIAAGLIRDGEQLVSMLIADETSAVNKWLPTLAGVVSHSIQAPILARKEQQLIVNIDEGFLELLKEFKRVEDLDCLERLGPETRMIYDRYDELTHSLQILRECVQSFNYILKVSNGEELEIFGQELETIEAYFEKASGLTWKTNNLDEIRKMHLAVKLLHERKVCVDKHVKSFEKSLQSATNKSIFSRSDPKSSELISLFNRDDEIQRRYRAIESLGKEQDIMLKTNFVLLYNIALPTSGTAEQMDALLVKRTRFKSELSVLKFEHYHAFASFYDGVYVERALSDAKWLAYLRKFHERMWTVFVDATRLNLSFFIYEMDFNENANPLFCITIEWRNGRIEGSPALRADSDGDVDFLTCVERILEEIYAMANKLTPCEENLTALVADSEVRKMSDTIRTRCRAMNACILEYLTQFDDYRCLWLSEKETYLKYFLQYAHIITIDNWLSLNDSKQLIDKEKKSPTLDQFKQQISYFEELCLKIEDMKDEHIFQRWLLLNIKPLKQALINEINKWAHCFKQHLYDCVINGITELEEFIIDAVELIAKPVTTSDANADGLINIMSWLAKIKDRQLITDNMFQPLRMIIDLLTYYDVDFPEAVCVRLLELPAKWDACKKVAHVTKQIMAPLQASQVNVIRRKLSLFDAQQQLHREHFKRLPIFAYNCERIYAKLDRCHLELAALESSVERLWAQGGLFELQMPEFKHVAATRRELRLLKELWDYVVMCNSWIDEWKHTPWKLIDVEAMDMDCKKFGKDLRAMDKELRVWDVYIQMEANLKNMLTSLRAVTELQNPSIRERHWNQLMKTIKTPGLNQSYYTVKFVMDPGTTLNDLLALRLHEYEDEVRNIVDKSIKEVTMEKTIRDLDETWSSQAFDFEVHERTQINILLVPEELIEIVEDHQVQLQNMLTSKFIEFFYQEITDWQKKLSNIDQVIAVFLDVQRKWGYLESIFIGSEDIRSQLADDSQHFDDIDAEFKSVLQRVHNQPNILTATNTEGFYEQLERQLAALVQCEKALNDYLETKRLAFPRFYFLSSADLLDILSNGNHPALIQRHLTKLFDSLAKLSFAGAADKRATAMFSKENEERVDFDAACACVGKVEIWLGALIDTMRETLRKLFARAVSAYEERARERWIYEYPAQVALVCIQIWWSTETQHAFARYEEGYEHALKDYNKKQISQLNTLISHLLGELSAGDRQKIMTICTIDVHSRDVINKLITMKVENAQAFQWQSQLRHQWDVQREDCDGNICDAQIGYQYEYLGNTPRLVITPLTDRCYITLTQSLHLVMGGAPAGPAGTGKTETTKDLGKALGIMVYVFNCSEQMDYKSVGNIYKGLVQTGTWGCFDEFNRISVEVLSVVAVQVKTIQDAIKHRNVSFRFLEEEIKLVDTVGIFITMNPGYAGRTELPENLKALFRPCAMVVPDFELICEIMLVAEGFQDARILARKFITLYTLCKELLSKQDHYDWGLRAIKSVLVVAGALKRGDRQRPEDQVLMRALRDFNIPKIITDDVSIFMGLIRDLFPALDVPRKRDAEFEKLVKKSSADLRLQAEDNFVLKVVQLEELFEVRHSVFIIGFAGTGKSMVWKTLFKTYVNQKRRPVFNDLNPKAVTNDELFGVINPATREWRDGLFSAIMREQVNLPGNSPRWIVLDGDIDPMWIESLNTLMDDNKVLTLASNERIALTPHMRLIFEIANLRTATPATVSRAGILYINPKDLGWNPYVASWLDTRGNPTERTLLSSMFDKYVPACLEVLETKFKKITPLVDVTHLSMLCHLLDCFLTPDNTPLDCPREWYETYFVFCAIWAFGSALCQDQIDWRAEFSKWFAHEYKTVRFPADGCVFDYYVDKQTKQFVPWSRLIDGFELNAEITLQATLVETMETRRVRFFLDHLMSRRIPCMLIGPSGCGKSVLVGKKLASLPENYQVTNVPFNFYTTSEMLQKILEKPLEKKAGRVFGPPGNKQMVYFIDDLNMPEIDKYFTVQPHTLLRQHIDYQHWYDRGKLSLKEIQNVQYVACMNPTAGSFVIDPRLQRHFCVFSLSAPTGDALATIYETLLRQHLRAGNFNAVVNKLCPTVVAASLALHQKVAGNFLPTAVKFHYVFNLRDLSNVFQGMLFTTCEGITSITDFIRVWMHESMRVYGDKMISYKDLDVFTKALHEIAKKTFEEFDEANVLQKPLIFCHFAEGMGDPKYLQIFKYERLHRLLLEALASYNDLVAAMNLVLFEDAMNHICRINRILEAPRGNLLLVGVGGTGKQSLTRLAAFIASLDVTQVQLKKGYAINDLRLDIAGMYMKAGMKNVATAFLMTDSQVADEEFLVHVNYMLAIGEIPDLITEDETEEILNLMKSEVKAAGLADTRENCWKFYVDKVRKLIKVVLCFSPVGSTLRIRARKFPAIINCTAINWFHDWPKEALLNVSKRFLAEIDTLPPEYVASASEFMSFVHIIVNRISQTYLAREKRYNYTTPKTFLEQIALYAKLLSSKTQSLKQNILRLENGLMKLKSTSDEVDALQEVLAVQEVELSAKNEAADKLIKILRAENEKVAKEQALASDEEAKVKIIEEDVAIKARMCEEDLRKAEPALEAAMEALNTLNKNNLTELKSFGSPPDAVVNVCAAVLVLFAKRGKIPKDRSWKACKMLMGKVDQFLNDLLCYDKENIHADVVRAVLPYVNDPEFEPNKIHTKSIAAAGLCAWVINIMRYYDIYLVVEPKRKALQKAQSELKCARQTLRDLKEKLQQLEKQLSALRAEYEAAIDAKLKCQLEADATATMINLARRLINGLASENHRWRDSVGRFKAAVRRLPGDVLLVTAFVSYVGCFTRKYRAELISQHWIPHLGALRPAVPMTEGLDPLALLTDDAVIANWNNEGLPTDRMSSENATILSNTARWPLMIDPQLQGLKWIKQRYATADLVVIRLGTKNYLDTIERCVSLGSIVLLENIGETIDGVLDPILSRVLVKKGRLIKIGDKEVDYNPDFKLIIQTKLSNPHYKPEIQAQTTLINFTVTRSGLEEQLLAEVVKAERPELETSKASLTKQQNDFKITLKTCEDNLLERLSSATGNILEDVTLVTNLETTKSTAADISLKAGEAKVTSVKIDEAREQYRPASARASLLYFILNDLNRINPIYQFSLKAFTCVFKKSLSVAAPASDLRQRVVNLLDSITYSVCMYTSRGLFERDKLIFLAQMTLQILVHNKEISPVELDFLLRFPVTTNLTSPYDFLSSVLWGGVKALACMDGFRGLDKDFEHSLKRWRKFVDSECPEKEKLPGEWKNRSALQRLCIMRCLRPDRMTCAVRAFIEEKLGAKFVQARTIPFEQSYEETSNSTPILFILSPGVNPLLDVANLGHRMGYTFEGGNFCAIALGQGQEAIAEAAIDRCTALGHWVMLQNIHLVERWLPTLEKKIEQQAEHSHPAYRLYLSADPAANVLPQGILESSIKITNESPTGMLANLHKALDNFTQETLEMCTKEVEFRAILFSLCYFHAVVAERRKFGPQGWNRDYPFNVGDLTISVNVLYNYLENNSKVPWEDLRYLFGEIMYGGHITDDWDRRLCRNYLLEYMQPLLLDGELHYAPGFRAPTNTDYVGYHRYIDEQLPTESPYLYGLHPNAEIGFLTGTSEVMFKTIFEMQSHNLEIASGVGMSREEKVRALLDEILEKLPEAFSIKEMMAKVEDRTPYVVVCLQECERMNTLMAVMRTSLKELGLGLKGELTITPDMEELEGELFLDKVPHSWAAVAYPSLLPLGQWCADLNMRIKELENWTTDFCVPNSVWLGGLFNPQSFLTAIMQQTARRNEWPLDKMCLHTEVTRKLRDDISSAPKEGANVHGLYIEGARWDVNQGVIADAVLKELFPMLPVVYLRAITQDKQDLRHTYECPVYKTRRRGPTYVWTFNLKTREKQSKWVLAGVATLLQV